MRTHRFTKYCGVSTCHSLPSRPRACPRAPVCDASSGGKLVAPPVPSSSTVLPASAEAEFEAELAVLVDDDASIVVLLAEAFDGAIVRAIMRQVCVREGTRGSHNMRGSSERHDA